MGKSHHLGGGYCQPHVQLRSDTNEVDFNQIVVDDESNLPLMDIARAQGWSRGGGANAKFITKGDVRRYTSIGGFRNNTAIKEFTEFRFFTGITQLGNYVFQNASNLEKIEIPSTCHYFGYQCFGSCNTMKGFEATLPIKTANQTFICNKLARCNSEYVGCIEDKNKGGGEWGTLAVQSPLINTFIYNWEGRPRITTEFERGVYNTRRIIINTDTFPAVAVSTFFTAATNSPSTVVYYSKNTDITPLRQKLTRCKYAPCDRDKFGNLVLPFRLKKWWEPDTT